MATLADSISIEVKVEGTEKIIRRLRAIRRRVVWTRLVVWGVRRLRRLFRSR